MTLPKSQKLSHDEMCEAWKARPHIKMVINLGDDRHLIESHYNGKRVIFSVENDGCSIGCKFDVYLEEMHDLYGDDSE
jgi:hypothetical protein